MNTRKYLLALPMVLFAATALANSNEPATMLEMQKGIKVEFKASLAFPDFSQRQSVVATKGTLRCELTSVSQPGGDYSDLNADSTLTLERDAGVIEDGTIIVDELTYYTYKGEHRLTLRCRDNSLKNPWNMKLADVQEAFGGVFAFIGKNGNKFAESALAKQVIETQKVSENRDTKIVTPLVVAEQGGIYDDQRGICLVDASCSTAAK